MAASLCARPPQRFFQFVCHRAASTSVSAQQVLPSSPAPKDQDIPDIQKKEEIVIPRKKKRDALSVLRALASTVTRDPNAPHYKYMDDPYLIPTSSLAKKSHALSKESGRKAARYILENYSQWFNENNAEPSVDAFMPPKLAYTHTEPTEAALLERIEKRCVKDAIAVYKKMNQNQQTLSQDACRQFLELLCVYNSQDPPVTLMPEESFFHKDFGGNNTRRPGKTWKDDDMAERVYDQLEEKSSEDHLNLIRGMARYLQTDKAFAMYDMMMEKKLPVDRLTFNELIRAATFHQDTYDTKWKQVESLLVDMQLSGVEPDLTTFNNVLFSLARIPLYQRAPSLTLQTLKEMRNLGMEPSLASWKHALTVFYPNENSESNMLYKVMDYLEGKELVLQDPDDLEFFLNAMKRCCQNLHDVDLALRIDRLLNTGDNVLLLGDSRAENMYYSFFLRVVCTFETLDTIMEVYQRVTPHLWTPNFSILEEVLKAVELQDGYTYLPLLWTDLMIFEFLRNATLVEQLLQLMARQKQEPSLQSQYQHIARQLLERWKEEQEEGRQPSLSTGAMMGHLITIAENSDDHNLAWSVFESYSSKRNTFSGLPGDQAMKTLVSGCLASGELEQAVSVVRAMGSLEMAGTGEAAQLILDSKKVVELSSAQRDMLANI
ncbi:small ribosomal subunit protein mS39-like [Babylonia areolata]|uniref:small ribosomal subunit protein mS39-like n=1 Tax=Babylonia areolata TaxID=304850 RepID=UPI003FD4EE5B